MQYSMDEESEYILVQAQRRPSSRLHCYWFDSDNNEVPEGDARAVGDRQRGRPATSRSGDLFQIKQVGKEGCKCSGSPRAVHTEHGACRSAAARYTPLLAPPQSNNQTFLPYHFFLYHTTSQTNQKSGNYHKNTGKTTSLPPLPARE